LSSGKPAHQLIINELNEEMYLPPVLDLKSILIVLFKQVKREAAFALIKEGLLHSEVNVEIFELSIFHDEEISM